MFATIPVWNGAETGGDASTEDKTISFVHWHVQLALSIWHH